MSDHLAPPPPSAELLAVVEQTRPVRTRVPGRALAILLALAAVAPAYTLVQSGPRADFGALPVGWVVGMAAVWAVAVAWLLARGVVPKRGQVLPSDAPAARAAALASVALVALGLAVTVDAPGHTRYLPFAEGFWHCTQYALRILVLVVAGALLLLGRVHPSGGVGAGAAIGAAAGAFAGLSLHVLCPFGGGLHVGLAHGGAAVLGGLLGAGTFAVARALRRR